ncbi:hypothetical protein CC85DRAFT_289471 [Cutaneotrichosporon oleaginosum]|uniref:Uncharacterized protein n=1 Tax=Cutaneotrichosporon oleaginosum TaxID=879819 RepID=A0A0J0XBP6_9TREE|nr:uncharacterized protein CC85DRAFT_289471 [Cutaneotrichosporon oleaginosum]KLT38495.1 hypothetical protein CC85DRAFT_289471 [Cutaneotrichosporon oleaginosum]TXT12569.1 hypothetical protein COLE_02979 [Cutaneotrichosporon oleaginosum]
MTWEAVFDAATFPRATLLDRRAVVGYLFPLPASTLDSSLPITLDAPPATLAQANAIALAWGHALAALVHDVVGLLDAPRALISDPPPPDGDMLRQTLAVTPAATPAWAPLMGAAHIQHRGVWDFTFPSAPAWARVAISVGSEVVLVVPRDMPLGAAAWAQVMRLALEVVDTGESSQEQEWDIASGLKPPMVNPVRITEARGAEARILPSDFESEEEVKKSKGTIFDRFRHAF